MMRVAFLCKRHYMRKDVIGDRYARLYEQPRQLALRGHQVLGICLSYRQTDERHEVHPAEPGNLHWLGLTPGRMGWLGALAYPWRMESALRDFSPELLVAASDSLHIVLGTWLAKRLSVPYAVDLYDNFESFGLSQIPGLRLLYRRAVSRAAVVSCVSGTLANLVKQDYQAIGQVITLPSTINRSLFRRLDKIECRKKLGLPIEARLIGTAGALYAARGIRPLYEAYSMLAENDPNLHLVLAGALDPDCPPPSGPRVHYLGDLPHLRTAELFNSLDVGIVYLRDTAYGRYSFPQKAYEMIACGLPVSVVRVGDMVNVFSQAPQSFYEPDDPVSLAISLEAQLSSPQSTDIRIRDWGELAEEMEATYLSVLKKR